MSIEQTIEQEQSVLAEFKEAVRAGGVLKDRLALRFKEVVGRYLQGANYNTLYGAAFSYDVAVTDDLKTRTTAAIAVVEAAHEARKVMLPLPTPALAA